MPRERRISAVPLVMLRCALKNMKNYFFISKTHKAWVQWQVSALLRNISNPIKHREPACTSKKIRWMSQYLFPPHPSVLLLGCWLWPCCGSAAGVHGEHLGWNECRTGECLGTVLTLTTQFLPQGRAQQHEDSHCLLCWTYSSAMCSEEEGTKLSRLFRGHW